MRDRGAGRRAREIAAAYADLGEPAVAVRSSAVGEDSGEATFAGQQETYLWVRGADGVCDAVRDCWASTFSAPAMSYRAKMAADRRPEMGVTVQLMVDAAVSGVMFTCNPVSGDPSVVAIDASWGLGLGVVGGEVTPDQYLVSKVTGEVVRRSVSAKHVEYRADPSGHGTVCVPVDEARQSEPCLDDAQLAALVDVARRVQKYFGAHQDVEWALAADGGLFVVQSRPVTATGGEEGRGRGRAAGVGALAGHEQVRGDRRWRRLMGLTDDDVREILRIIDESELDELRIDMPGFRLHVRRGGAPAPEPAAPAAGDAPEPEPAAAPRRRSRRAVAPTAPRPSTRPCSAPSTARARPASSRSSTSARRSTPDTVVCLIEVMKMMNSVKAGVRGTVVEVCASNAELVEYGEPLFRVDPAA